MYSTCLFCQHSLGRNESFESFPVGTRLAYDPARGRLWVVCRRCARWNLTPLEERWEAIDEAERRVHGTRRRVSTGEIAMARLPEGTELVRIGKAPRLELAAWRYGDALGRRRVQGLIVAGAVVATGGATLAGAVAAGLAGFTAWQIGNTLVTMTRFGFPGRTIARIRAPNGMLLRITPTWLHRTRLGVTEDRQLELVMQRRVRDAGRANGSPIRFVGQSAERVLGQLVPAVNRFGGTRTEIEEALQRLDASSSPSAFLTHAARLSEQQMRFRKGAVSRALRPSMAAFLYEPERDGHGLFALPRTLSLAIEIVSNEERERRAMEGELALLEAAWREAEEVAQIADGL